MTLTMPANVVKFAQDFKNAVNTKVVAAGLYLGKLLLT